ncbi:hypothetical protein FHS16_005279 [Paenibacillus endophyticus]|uniref:Uncharacterized protein n=1 Tax=Paenibacillus endophyticus TaxID=1294268 RepID=A0A7W5GCS2_9BACL|nr:hypothetical protein [Paenibacillus endophyticus]
MIWTVKRAESTFTYQHHKRILLLRSINRFFEQRAPVPFTEAEESRGTNQVRVTLRISAEGLIMFMTR